MLSRQGLEKIFNQKKQKIGRKKGKDGLLKERLIAGFETTLLTNFLDWYTTSEYACGCYYCGTTAAKSFELYSKAIQGTSNWTRGGKRGKRLELDRKDPFKKYDDLNNLVWCCYWSITPNQIFLQKKNLNQLHQQLVQH